MTNFTAAERYAVLCSDRDVYLDRARRCSLLTLPHLFPPEGAEKSTSFITPYQGLGARGVNNLSAKLLLSLFPVNTPFFKMELGEKELQEAEQMGEEGSDVRTQISTGLSKLEKRVQKWMEAKTLRPSVDEALKHLVVGGNVLVQVMAKVGIKTYRLDKYVTRRDPTGKVLETITKEPVARDALPPKIQELLEPAPPQVGDKPAPAEIKHIYTAITFDHESGMYKVRQEIDKKTIPGSEGSYKEDECPFIPLRFTKVDGEDYGRSYIEQYYGDLKSLEGLTKAVVLSAQVVAKAIVLVRPGGVTKAEKITKAETGDAIYGNKDDVHMLQFDKWADLRVAFEAIKELTQRLGFAFLLNTAVQRPGDRVTAEEIRYMARELDDALGGTYATLSQDFQLPFVRAVIVELSDPEAGSFRLPKLPAGINPVVVGGLEALGRGHDLAKLDQFVGTSAQLLGPEVLQRINVDNYLKRRALASGIDIEGLFLTDEQIATQKQQAMMQQLAAKLGPNAVTQMGQMAQNDQQANAKEPNG